MEACVICKWDSEGINTNKTVRTQCGPYSFQNLKHPFWYLNSPSSVPVVGLVQHQAGVHEY
jgi:hypothetical protein